jgi:hypothetical protein
MEFILWAYFMLMGWAESTAVDVLDIRKHKQSGG